LTLRLTKAKAVVSLSHLILLTFPKPDNQKTFYQLFPTYNHLVWFDLFWNMNGKEQAIKAVLFHTQKKFLLFISRE